jgi:hypothetical protein
MNLSGGSACIKYLLFIFNLVFVVSVMYYAVTVHKIRRVCQVMDFVYGAVLFEYTLCDFCVTHVITSLEFCCLLTAFTVRVCRM